MGRLAHLQTGLAGVQERLSKADKSDDVRRGELDGLLDGRFNKVSDRLEGALNRLMSESDKAQNKSLSDAVDGVVRAVSQTHSVFTDGISRLSGRFEKQLVQVRDELKSELSGVTGSVGSSGQSLTAQLKTLEKSINQIPTRFPVQVEPDLTPILMGMKELSQTPDITPQLKKLEEKMGKRVYEFNVERESFSDLIKRIVVVEK